MYSFSTGICYYVPALLVARWALSRYEAWMTTQEIEEEIIQITINPEDWLENTLPKGKLEDPAFSFSSPVIRDDISISGISSITSEKSSEGNNIDTTDSPRRPTASLSLSDVSSVDFSDNSFLMNAPSLVFTESRSSSPVSTAISVDGELPATANVYHLRDCFNRALHGKRYSKTGGI